MKEVKDHCMLNGVYGTIINFLLKKLSNLRKINEQQFSRHFNRISPGLSIPLRSNLCITVHRSNTQITCFRDTIKCSVCGQGTTVKGNMKVWW